MSTLIVIAKSPVPGRVKTRLTPPFTAERAADLARAALEDTLEAVGRTDVTHRLLVLEGGTDTFTIPEGFTVIPQIQGTLDRRIAAAFEAAARADGGPSLLVGMDTPQVTSGLLASCLPTDHEDATIGLAEDGGFWSLGFRSPRGIQLERVLFDVPMSTPQTGALQLARLQEAGLRTRILPELSDFDTAADADRVAAECPRTRFAATLRATRVPAGSAR